MSASLEETLIRELREVATDLHVPPMPALPTRERPRPSTGWMPALVAAAVVVLLLGAIAALRLVDGGESKPLPAGPSRTDPTPPDRARPISRVVPSVPYLLGGRLFALDQQVPGEWNRVWSGGVTWLAQRADGTWWYSTDTRPHRIEVGPDDVPVLSPGGTYVAWVDNAAGMITGFSTLPGAEGFGGVPIDLGDPALGDPVRVRAVTEDGLVVAQGQDVAVLWRPVADGTTVDLTGTAPGEVVLAGTPAGIVVSDQTDGTQGEPSLAQLSKDGTITRTTRLPTYDDLVISPDGGHTLWSPAGTLAGEVMQVDSLQVAKTGGDPSTINPPEGWSFATLAWTWEDQTFVARVVDASGEQRMVRCDPEQERCVLTQT